MNWTEFLAMGGYAIYVWPSFALTAVVLIYNVYSARRNHAEAIAQANRRLAMQEKGS